MTDILEQAVSVPYNRAVRQWKEAGRKVAGVICCYVPEEILWAAEVLPYRIRATGCAGTSRADAWMSNFSCSFTRACLELALDGTYDFLDALVGSDSCGHAHRLYDNWRFGSERSLTHFLTVPRKVSQSAFAWYRDELEALRGAVESLSGIPVTAERLQSAIALWNETRDLLQEFQELRRQDLPPVTGAEMQGLILAAMSLPKDQANSMLRDRLAEVRSRPASGDRRPRLLVVGSAIDDPRFIQLIEDRGGIVVADALCLGSRYLSGSISTDGDPMDALTRGYLDRAICPRMTDQHANLLELVQDLVRDFRVDGVIYGKLQYCDLWGGESLFLETKLKERGIPVLTLQREQVVTNRQQITTRVEAFLEMIGELI